MNPRVKRKNVLLKRLRMRIVYHDAILVVDSCGTDHVRASYEACTQTLDTSPID